MGESLMKGEAYEKDKKQKQELFLTSMKYYVWGVDQLNYKEKKMLKLAGVIKPSRRDLILTTDEVVLNSNEGSKTDLSKNSTK